MAKKSADDTIVDIQGVIASSESFFEKNRKGIIIGISAIALAFAGFFAYQFLYKQPKEKDAANLIYPCDYWAEKDSLDWAVNGKDGSDGYLAIAENFAGTKAGMRANYWCGVYFRDVKGDFNAALEHFKKADFDDNAVGVMAMGNVGDMYINLGQMDEGASWLEKTAKKANNSASRDYTGPFYSLKAAKAQIELGNNDKAKSLLQYVVDNYDKKNPDFMESEKLLAYLNAMQ